jgi:hypothetical protein
MCMDRSDRHNLLSPHLTKIEMLCALSPVCETDRETARVLGLLLEVVQDYATALRHTLDDMPRGEGTEGGHS